MKKRLRRRVTGDRIRIQASLSFPVGLPLDSATRTEMGWGTLKLNVPYPALEESLAPRNGGHGTCVGISRAPKQEPVVPQIPVPLTLRTAQGPAKVGQFSVACYVQDLYCVPHREGGQGNGTNSIDGSEQGCLKSLRTAKAVHGLWTLLVYSVGLGQD